MKIFKPGESQLVVNGVVYVADENGIIDIPKSQISPDVWARGFVDARAKLAELERLDGQRPADQPQQAVDKPAAMPLAAAKEPQPDPKKPANKNQAESN